MRFHVNMLSSSDEKRLRLLILFDSKRAQVGPCFFTHISEILSQTLVSRRSLLSIEKSQFLDDRIHGDRDRPRSRVKHVALVREPSWVRLFLLRLLIVCCIFFAFLFLCNYFLIVMEPRASLDLLLTTYMFFRPHVTVSLNVLNTVFSAKGPKF